MMSLFSVLLQLNKWSYISSLAMVSTCILTEPQVMMDPQVADLAYSQGIPLHLPLEQAEIWMAPIKTII